MLTNSTMDEMNKLLGERVMDRMRLGNSLWVNFTGIATAIALPVKSIERFPSASGVILKRFLSNDEEYVYEIFADSFLRRYRSRRVDGGPYLRRLPGRTRSIAPPASSAAVPSKAAAVCRCRP